MSTYYEDYCIPRYECLFERLSGQRASGQTGKRSFGRHTAGMIQSSEFVRAMGEINVAEWHD